MPGDLRAVLWYLLIASLPVSATLFRVWVHQDVVEHGYRISEEERRRQRTQEELRQLEVALAAERAPARLARLASELGLVSPRPEQLIAAPHRGRTEPRPPVASTTASGGDHGRP